MQKLKANTDNIKTKANKLTKICQMELTKAKTQIKRK